MIRNIARTVLVYPRHPCKKEAIFLKQPVRMPQTFCAPILILQNLLTKFYLPSFLAKDLHHVIAKEPLQQRKTGSRRAILKIPPWDLCPLVLAFWLPRLRKMRTPWSLRWSFITITKQGEPASRPPSNGPCARVRGLAFGSRPIAPSSSWVEARRRMP